MNTTYKEIILYYFSGTGNAQKAAYWMNEVAQNNNLPCSVINIESGKIPPVPPQAGTLTGIIGPTHGFNFPPIVFSFLKRLPPSKGTPVFIMNTRGGLKAGRFFLPGLSGLVHYISWFILTLKGYRVVGLQPLDMPSSWISLHPGIREKVLQSIIERCEKITKRFFISLLSGKKRYKALLSLPFDLAVFPLAIAYYLAGRFALAKTFYADHTCNGCRLCVNNCPTKSIKMIKGRPYWGLTCESCMRCMNLCPKQSVQTAHVPAILLWAVGFPLINAMFLAYLFHILPMESAFWKETTRLVSYTLLVLAGTYLLYFPFHFFLRFKGFNKVIQWLSFTSYPFWRRYLIKLVNKRLPLCRNNTK